MNEEHAVKGEEAVTNEPAPTLERSLTPHQMLAARIAAGFAEYAAMIPGFSDDLSKIPKNLRRTVRGDFVEMILAAVDGSEELQGIRQLDTTACRDTLQFSEAYQQLFIQLDVIKSRLGELLRVKEARLGQSTLQIYHIARRLARNPNYSQLRVAVAALRAELRRQRIGWQGRKAKKPAPSPALAEDDGKGK